MKNRHPAFATHRLLRLTLTTLVFLAAIPATTTLAAEPVADTAAADPARAQKLENLLERGFEKLRQREAKAACRVFEEAVELSGGRSFGAQLGLASARLKADQPKAAAAAAEGAEALGTTPAMQAAAANLLGLSLYTAANQDPAELAKAESALERAIALDPQGAAPARITLAHVNEALGAPLAAATLLRETLTMLPKGNQLRREARVKLCALRSDHPELSAELAAKPIDPRAFSENPPQDLAIAGTLTKPKGLFQPDPQYPAEARMARVEGVVVMQGIIDRDGCIRELTQLKGVSQDVDQAAAETVKRWVFEPALLDGKPVDVYYNLTTSFRLTSSTPSFRPFH